MLGLTTVPATPAGAVVFEAQADIKTIHKQARQLAHIRRVNRCGHHNFQVDVKLSRGKTILQTNRARRHTNHRKLRLLLRGVRRYRAATVQRMHRG